MNISTILVVVPVHRFDAALETLAGVSGVEVHHHDAETGRIVITQEAETIHDEVAGLERIQTLPDVILAEMVSHYFEDDPEILDGYIPGASQTPAIVPAFLDDGPLNEGPTVPDPRAENGEE